MAHKIVSRHLLPAVGPHAGDGEMASHIYNAVFITKMLRHSTAMYYFTAGFPVVMGVFTRPAKPAGVISGVSIDVSHSAI